MLEPQVILELGFCSQEQSVYVESSCIWELEELRWILT